MCFRPSLVVRQFFREKSFQARIFNWVIFLSLSLVSEISRKNPSRFQCLIGIICFFSLAGEASGKIPSRFGLDLRSNNGIALQEYNPDPFFKRITRLLKYLPTKSTVVRLLLPPPVSFRDCKEKHNTGTKY